jgi:cytochrome d ubiquinol oxidase subunit I
VMFSMALWMAALVAPLQLVAGDLHGLNTLEYQPAKVAAIEGHFESGRGLPLYLFGIPDMEAGTMRSAIAVPKLGSLILTHDPNGAIKGLKDFPRENWPNVNVLFWTFRLMVGLGLVMIAMGLWSLVQRGRRRLYDARWLMRMMVAMGPMGFVALVAGWFTTEVGRQPFAIYGLLRTADSVSPIASPAVGASLFAFVAIYLTVFGAGIFYIFRLMSRWPGAEPEQPEIPPIRSAGITPAAAVAEHRGP